MKTYSINIPTIDGILSDDFIYFEGINRPNDIFILKDENNDTKNRNIDLLEKYFNDIYNLFLRKLSAFAMFESTNNEETIKMQALLQELIKVKNIIINTESYKDQDLL